MPWLSWLCIIIVSWMHLKKHFKCFHHCKKHFFLISNQSPQELETINYVMACFAFIQITCVANIKFSAFLLLLSCKSWQGKFRESVSWHSQYHTQHWDSSFTVWSIMAQISCILAPSLSHLLVQADAEHLQNYTTHIYFLHNSWSITRSAHTFILPELVQTQF